MASSNPILKNTAYLAVAEIAKPLLAFALILIVSRRLGPSGVGAYTVVITFTLLIETIATVGLSTVFTRGIAAERPRLAYYASGAYGASLLATAVFLPVAFIILRTLHYPPEVDRGIRWLLFTLPVAILQQYVLSICEGLQYMRIRSVISFLDTAGRVVFGVIMIALGHGVVGIIQGMVLTRVLTTALGLILLGSEVYAQFSFESFRISARLLRMGIPFLFTALTSTIFWSVNTLMLSKMTRLDEVGIYNAASRLSDVLKGMIYSYLIALLPVMSASFAESLEALRRQCDASIKYMAIVSLPISTGVAILAPQIIRIIYGHKFDGAIPVLAVLSWTVSAFTISLVFARALVASHNQLWDLWCNTAALVVNIVAGFLLIPRYGPVGAGFAGLISLASFGLFEYLALSNRLFRPVVLAPLARTLLSCLAMAAALYPIRSLPIILTIPAGAIVYSIALFVTGSFTQDEITFLRAAITQRLRRNKLALPTHPVIAGEPEL